MALFSRNGGKRKKSDIVPELPQNLYGKKCSKTFDHGFIDNIIEDLLNNVPYNKHKSLLTDPISDNICTATKRRKGFVPEWLRCGGNSKSWNELIEEMNKNQLGPIVIWGPSGSGKTCGVKDCASACGLRVFEIEPSVLDSTENLSKWFLNIVSSRTLLGPRALLIDIIEGFDESYIHLFEKILKKHKTFNIPVIFIADSIYSTYSLKKLFSLISRKIRIYTQCKEKIVRFAKMTFAHNYMMEIIDAEAEYCDGNIRKLHNRLKSEYFVKLNDNNKTNRSLFSLFSDDGAKSLFSSTQMMLLGKIDIEKWTMASDHNSLKRLMWDNYLSFSTNLDSICEFASFMSEYYVRDDDYYMYTCGLYFKHISNIETTVPRMTLTSTIKKNSQYSKKISTYNDYLMQSSFLYMPELLKDHQTYDTE